MSKPILQLYDSIGLGVILSHNSGVVYSNQTGGTSNLDPCMEGVYLPLRNDYSDVTKEFLSPENDLTKYFTGYPYFGQGATSGITEDDATRIEEILSKYRLHQVISVDRARLADSHEAWIYIRVNGNEIQGDADLSAWSGFSDYPIGGVLTWCNSD